MIKQNKSIFSIEYWKGKTYALWALYLPIYLIMFFAVEQIVGSDSDYVVSYMAIDDKIPFCEYFVPFYYLWYPLLAGVGLYALFNDGDAFRRYMIFIAFSFTISIIFFLAVPNGQDLRPITFEHDNILVDMIKGIYAVDTNTNVFPSVHVIGSIAAAIVAFDCKGLKDKMWVKVSVTTMAFLVSISTVFVKQHSFLDVLGGVGFSILSYVVVYIFINKYIIKRQKKKENLNAE